MIMEVDTKCDGVILKLFFEKGSGMYRNGNIFVITAEWATESGRETENIFFNKQQGVQVFR